MTFKSVDDVEQYARQRGSGAVELHLTLGDLSADEELLIYQWRAMRRQRRTGALKRATGGMLILALLTSIAATWLSISLA